MSPCISFISILIAFRLSPERRIDSVVESDAPVDQAGTPAQTQGEEPLPLEVVGLQQGTYLPVDPSEVRACSRRRGTQVLVLGSYMMNQVYQSHLS